MVWGVKNRASDEDQGKGIVFKAGIQWFDGLLSIMKNASLTSSIFCEF